MPGKTFNILMAVVLMVAACIIGPSIGYSADEGELKALLEQGIWHYKHENYEEARDLFEKLRKEEPGSTFVAYYLGITHKQLQNYNAAKPHLEAAVTMEPRIKNALTELIDLLYKKGKIKEALKWIEVAEKGSIHPSQTAFFKGLVLLKEGEDLKGAIEAFERAKELDETVSHTADYYIGLAYIKSKNLEDAKDIFKEIVTRGPNTSLAAYAEQYIDAINRKAEASKPFRAYISYAWQFDDNLVLKPSASGVASTIEDQSDMCQAYTFNGEYSFKPVDFFGTRFGYSFYGTKQFDMGFYDTISHNFYMNPTFYLEQAAISFPINYNFVTVNDKGYLSSVGISNLNNIKLGNNQMWQIGLAYKRKKFLWAPSSPGEDRDSHESAAHAGWFYFFAGKKGFANIRYKINYDHTEEDNWKYIGNRVTLASTVPVTDRIGLGSTVDYSFQQFLKPHSVFEKKRQAGVFTVAAYVSFEIMKGAEVRAGYTFVDNWSNISLYDYIRSVYNITFKYTF